MPISRNAGHVAAWDEERPDITPARTPLHRSLFGVLPADEAGVSVRRIAVKRIAQVPG